MYVERKRSENKHLHVPCKYTRIVGKLFVTSVDYGMIFQTHAEYSEGAQYLTHRLVQAFDIAQFIRLTSRGSDLAVLAADLNSKPDELCYKIITEYADLSDSFQVRFGLLFFILFWGNENLLFIQPDGVTVSGTFGCSRNSYTNVKSCTYNPQGERIDYILYKARTDLDVSIDGEG